MMRNMIAANTKVFSDFDNYLQSRGAPADNAGEIRWIATNDDEEVDLKRFSFTSEHRISPSKFVSRFDDGSDQVFVTVGFDQAVESTFFQKIPMAAGLLTAVLADCEPRPVASILTVQDIVSAQDKRDSSYGGHTASDIFELFPTMLAFDAQNIDFADDAKIFFDFVLSDATKQNGWIDDKLAKSLEQLYILNLIGIPYNVLAHSLSDPNPSSLFLALYKCLESLYSRTASERIKKTLNVASDWKEISVALENDLGWRPIEAGSLESLVNLGAEREWTDIQAAIAPAFPGFVANEEATRAARLIYKLRNSVVHFRPIHSRVQLKDVDWPLLCSAMVNLVSYVYSEIFESL